MKLSSVRSFYRFPSDEGSFAEDGTALNLKKRIFAVFDGVSGPYSLSNPKIDYGGLHVNYIAITGGQMVGREIQRVISDMDIDSLGLELRLQNANQRVCKAHQAIGKDPMKEAVAGACVSACQISEEEITFVMAGDAFVLFQDDNGFHFLTNFDQAAFDFEEKGNEEFAKCLKEANGNIKRAWDLYFPYFSYKQFFRANKNSGKGGHSMLNGDPAFKKCWTKQSLSLTPGIKWILLGTDGMLHRNFRPDRDQVNNLAFLYIAKGIEGILGWRDEKDNLPHIKNPEASAIELKFEK